MIITWHKQGAVKIQDKETLVAINPHADLSKFSCDLALLGDSSATSEALREQPFIINNPGEYEVKDVFVYGIPAKGVDGSAVTVFACDVDRVMIGHLGGIMQDQLTQEQLEVLEGVDILMIPVGGDDSLNARQAVKMINQIEPRIVIPINYGVGKDKKEGVEVFLKEFGAISKHEKVEKLKIVKKDLPMDDTKVIVVEPS